MKIYVGKKFKEEKAAVSLLIFVTVLSFVAILLGAYVTVTSLRKSQLESDIRLQEIYGKDVERVDEIYEEIIAKDNKGPTCEINYNIVNDTNISYRFTFSEYIKNFMLEDIKLYSANNVNTSFGNEITLSTSSPTYTVTLNKNKVYAIKFDYRCIADSQEFNIGLYSDIETNLPNKKLIATNVIKHEEYMIHEVNADVTLKILAQIQESNNIIITNLEIVELSDIEVKKGAFVKNSDKEYTLVAQYDNNMRYVITLDDNAYTDLTGNGNEEIIKII